MGPRQALLGFVFSGCFSVAMPCLAEAPETGRFRLSYDLGASAGLALGPSCEGTESCAMISPASAVDLGHQFSRSFALFFRAELGSLFLASNFGGAFVVFEATPVRALSVGLGSGYELSFGLNKTTVGPGGIPARGYGGVVFPILVHLNLMGGHEWEKPGRHHSARIGIEVVPGFGPETGNTLVRGMLTFGYAYM